MLLLFTFVYYFSTFFPTSLFKPLSTKKRKCTWLGGHKRWSVHNSCRGQLRRVQQFDLRKVWLKIDKWQESRNYTAALGSRSVDHVVDILHMLKYGPRLSDHLVDIRVEMWVKISWPLVDIHVEMWVKISWPLVLSLIHIWRCRRDVLCRSRWSPYH